MSLVSPPKLPPEIQSIVLRLLADDLRSWEAVRKHLHLRLVSSWFGSSFEEAAFQNIHVEIESSPSSHSNHLVKLLQFNAKLADNVKCLTATDVHAFSAFIQAVSTVQTGTAAFYACIDAHGKGFAQHRNQLAHLIRACVKLQTLGIYSAYSSAAVPEVPLFSSDMKDLRAVWLQSAAIGEYFRDCVRSGLSPSTWLMITSTKDIPFLEDSQSLASRLTSGWTSPPPVVKGLEVDAAVDFIVPFLAKLPLRPDYLSISLPDYGRLREVVDSLIEGSYLGDIGAIRFKVNSTHLRAGANQPGLAPEILQHVERLRAAGPAELLVDLRSK